MAALALLSGGCSASNQGVRPIPTPTPPVASLPAGGQSLASLGFHNGPVDRVFLPAQVRLDQRVDQPNVVIATMPAPSGTELAEWLKQALPGGGFRIDAQGNDSILFSGFGWSGAFTASGQLSALTLRRNPD